jgi:hypothetical protein
LTQFSWLVCKCHRVFFTFNCFFDLLLAHWSPWSTMTWGHDVLLVDLCCCVATAVGTSIRGQCWPITLSTTPIQCLKRCQEGCCGHFAFQVSCCCACADPLQLQRPKLPAEAVLPAQHCAAAPL